MTQYERQQARQTGVFYAEDQSAITWPYYFHLALWAVVLAAGITAELMTGDAALTCVPMGLGFFGVVFTLGFMYQNWPVGIRIGDDGIRIGAVRRRPNPPGKQPWSDYQRWQELSAPWNAVRQVAVITDKPGLRDARMLGNRDVNRIGVLTAPFTRAVLLIAIAPGRVSVPDFREPDEKLPMVRPGHRTPFEPSPVWYVPTRRPDALRQALIQHAGSISGQSSQYLPSYLRLLFERAEVTGD